MTALNHLMRSAEVSGLILLLDLKEVLNLSSIKGIIP
jgi:hypothetical protein